MDNFNPNWYSPPGDTIRDALKINNLTVSDLADQLDISNHKLNRLLEGSLALDAGYAMGLSRLVGSTTEYWLKREAQYRADLQRLDPIDEREWIKSLPLRDMKKFGWINGHKDLLDECLSFFQVPDIQSWKIEYLNIIQSASFKISDVIDSTFEATSAWLRAAEIECEKTIVSNWNQQGFYQSLHEIKKLSRLNKPSRFIDQLKSACADHGVVLVVSPTPKGCAAWGASKMYEPDKALILLSHRYRTDDHFWFTFFHEAAHLVLHNSVTTNLEIGDSRVVSKMEDEANDFARDVLISPEQKDRLARMGLTRKNIITFAREANVSAGIVVGQLQHMGRLKFSHYNKFKRVYDWNSLNPSI